VHPCLILIFTTPDTVFKIVWEVSGTSSRVQRERQGRASCHCQCSTNAVPFETQCGTRSHVVTKQTTPLKKTLLEKLAVRPLLQKLPHSQQPSANPYINLLQPTCHVMHHQQFNIQQLYALPTLYLCVLYLSENKQRLVPLTA